MSKLLQNILKNSRNALNESDMTKTSDAMMRYLGVGYPYNEVSDVPIEPEAASWNQVSINNKTCLQRTYEFDSPKFLLYFVNEVINHSEEVYHHPEIFISHRQVTLTLYTQELNDISERDIELAKKIDEIIEDINVIKFRV